MEYNTNEEIDLKELFYLIRSKIWIILLTGILTASGTGLVSSFCMTPIYTSTAKLYILGKSASLTDLNLSDLQLGSQLTQDYMVLVKSRPVVTQVIENLGLDMTYEKMVSILTTNNPSNTRILEIRADYPDPYLAKKIVDEFAAVSSSRIAKIMDTSEPAIVEEGFMQPYPSGPDIKKNILIGGFLGIILAGGLIIVLHLLNDTIKDSEDVERYLDLNTLGLIPIESGLAKAAEHGKRKQGLWQRRHKGNRNHKETQAVEVDQITFAKRETLDYRVNEVYKTLRTNIQFCGDEVKVLTFTSCTPNEGKSSVAFNLAVSFAETGKKVILIDADLRKSVLAGRYKVGAIEGGLTHYLSGQKELNDILLNSGIENMDIIFAGTVVPNPAELLEHQRFGSMVKKLREHYDYVLIDTPPLGSVIDSAIVAKVSDGTVLVIESNSVNYRFARDVKIQIEKSGCRILGVILNKVPMEKRGYYGKYYGKYYGTYGEEK